MNPNLQVNVYGLKLFAKATWNLTHEVCKSLVKVPRGK